MLGVGYFGTKPTQIRLTAAEYLSPIQRNELTIRGSAFGTNWTRDMLLRLQQLSQSGLEDATILTMLKEEFNGPETVAEITQERVFMAMSMFVETASLCILIVLPLRRLTWCFPLSLRTEGGFLDAGHGGDGRRTIRTRVQHQGSHGSADEAVQETE